MFHISSMGSWLMSLNGWKFYATAWEVRESLVTNDWPWAIQPIISVSYIVFKRFQV